MRLFPAGAFRKGRQTFISATPKPSKESEFKKPVAWLLGRQLISSLKQLVLYTVFSGKLDPRDWMRPTVFSARGPNSEEIIESGEPAAEPRSGEFWFDYIADTGDGQLATYSVAYLCFSDMCVESAFPPVGSSVGFVDPVIEEEATYHLPRGRFLLIGGDSAYHIADYATLAERFRNPFRWAASDKDIDEMSERRPLFGLPGNHDYYDVLDGFNRQFRRPTSPEDEANREGFVPQLSIPGFQRLQTASYLALRLPFDWWLWAVDTEVGGVDIRQQEFFKYLAGNYDVRKLIVATSEPTTALGRRAKPDDKTARAFARLGLAPRFLLHSSQSPDERVEYELAPDSCRVDLSGDAHHYARYWGPAAPGSPGPEANNYASVVSGLGGAFLHPSHTDLGEIEAQVKYPLPKESRKALTGELLKAINIINGGYVWLIALISAAFISFAAVAVPSSRAVVNTALSEVHLFNRERLAQPSGLLNVTPDKAGVVVWSPDIANARELQNFLSSFWLWLAMIAAAAMITLAAQYPRLLFKAAYSDIVRPVRYWPVWLLTVGGVALFVVSLWKFGIGHSSAEVVSDLVFLTMVIGGPLSLSILGFLVGGENLNRAGKFLIGALGLWHGVVQVIVPFLLVRLGNLPSIGVTLLIMGLAASIGVALSRAVPSSKSGGDHAFGFALLSVWVVSIAAVIAAVLYLPEVLSLPVYHTDSPWALLIPIAAAGGIGALMSCVSLGWYFAVAAAVNAHNEQAGGAARIEQFKQIIRFRVTARGLTAFVIAFDQPRMHGSELKLTLIDVFNIAPLNDQSISSLERRDGPPFG